MRSKATSTAAPPCLERAATTLPRRRRPRCALAAAPAPADDWTGLQPGVISRMRAEAHESLARACAPHVRRHAPGLDRAWPRRPRRSSAARSCSACCTSRRRSATTRWRAMIAVMARPVGLGPESGRASTAVIQRPERARGRLGRSDAGEHDVGRTNSCWRSRWSSRAKGACRASKCSATSTTSAGLDARCSTPSRASRSSRLSAARFPIAVNLVWLLAHMTVKGKPLKGRRSARSRSSRAVAALSATAVATLFIASVARMMTLRGRLRSRPASPRTPPAANPQCRPSGTTTRHRLASSEYSTRCTADCSSRTTNLIVAFVPLAPPTCTSMCGGGVVDVER